MHLLYRALHSGTLSKSASPALRFRLPPFIYSSSTLYSLFLSTDFASAQIRLLTTQNASADTIRLWLERSGDSVPLDIEIFLRVRESPDCSSRRRRRSLSPIDSPPPLWAIPLGPPTSHYVMPPPHGSHTVILPPAQVPVILPPSPGYHDPWSSVDHQNDRTAPAQSRTSLHWGHIAIFYLVEQMHRWERFIFRFDKQFTSMGALKSISGVSSVSTTVQ